MDSDYCILIKGAPEKIWAFSTEILVGEGRSKVIGEKE